MEEIKLIEINKIHEKINVKMLRYKKKNYFRFHWIRSQQCSFFWRMFFKKKYLVLLTYEELKGRKFRKYHFYNFPIFHSNETILNKSFFLTFLNDLIFFRFVFKEIDFGQHASQLSDGLKDLIRRCLAFYVADRIVIEKVISHPWMNATNA